MVLLLRINDVYDFVLERVIFGCNFLPFIPNRGRILSITYVTVNEQFTRRFPNWKAVLTTERETYYQRGNKPCWNIFVYSGLTPGEVIRVMRKVITEMKRRRLLQIISIHSRLGNMLLTDTTFTIEFV